MKNLKVNRWLIGFTLVLLLAGFHVNAQRGRGNGPGRGYGDAYGRGNGEGPGHSNRMEAFLDLSDEQVGEIEKLHLDFQKKTLPARNKISEKNAQLKTLITEGANQSKINPLIEVIGDLRTEIQKSRMNTHLKVRELLTDEQKIKFDNHFTNRFNQGEAFSRQFGRHGKGWQ